MYSTIRVMPDVMPDEFEKETELIGTQILERKQA